MSIRSCLMRLRPELVARAGSVAVLTAIAVLGGLGSTTSADTAGAPAGPAREVARSIDLGSQTSCVVMSNGAVNCWGSNGFGELGRGNTQDVGDDETPATAGPLNLGAGVKAVEITIGSLHNCVLLDNATVKCFGNGLFGRTGYGNTDVIGDDETPASVGTVDVGGTVSSVTAGSGHTCALLTTGRVRCWGRGVVGQLGTGTTADIGDDELPATGQLVDFGPGITATAVTAGSFHTCALLSNGTVKCWGDGSQGQLGYGNTDMIGDNETLATIGPVDVGGQVASITAGSNHTCALLVSGAVKCWGLGGDGQLGYGNSNRIGDDELPSTVGTVNVGGDVAAISAGDYHTCALLVTKNVTCWGDGNHGQLGYGNTSDVGRTASPATAGTVNLGSGVTAEAISGGGNHTCAVLTTGSVKCWGRGSSGQLGYASTSNVGNSATPASVGAVELGGVVTTPTTTTTTTTTTSTTVPVTTVPVAPTTTSPTVTPSTITKTVKRGSATSVTKLLKLPTGTRTYSISGGCKLNARRTSVIAPKKKATCRLTVKGKKGRKTTTVRVTIKVK